LPWLPSLDRIIQLALVMSIDIDQHPIMRTDMR
jgi:hypothetical protein